MSDDTARAPQPAPSAYFPHLGFWPGVTDAEHAEVWRMITGIVEVINNGLVALGPTLMCRVLMEQRMAIVNMAELGKPGPKAADAPDQTLLRLILDHLGKSNREVAKLAKAAHPEKYGHSLDAAEERVAVVRRRFSDSDLKRERSGAFELRALAEAANAGDSDAARRWDALLTRHYERYMSKPLAERLERDEGNAWNNPAARGRRKTRNSSGE